MVTGSARNWALLALCVLLGGCATVAYLGQAASGQWRLLHARQPVAQVLRRADVPESVRRQLTLLQQARLFAVQQLALPDNPSYQSYSDLHRDYAVWNVVAAPEFSVNPKNWCYPLVGCLSYRGYFHPEPARKLAARLQRHGFDTLVEGVAAYSTLGHFDDPLLSTMLRYDDIEAIGTVFHELAHQVVYVSGDTAFNESYAMVVEEEGLRRWLATQHQSQRWSALLQQRQLDNDVTALLIDGRSRLQELYAQPLSAAQMRLRKREVLGEITEQIRTLEGRRSMSSGYEAWLKAPLNNAHLAAVSTYQQCIPGFAKLLAAVGGQMSAFHQAVRAMRRDAAARANLCATPAPRT